MAKTPWEMADVGAEFSHQTALFAWAAMARIFGPDLANDPNSYTMPGYARSACKRDEPLPELEWLHAIKNQGHGDAIRGGRSRAEGVKAGVFDVFLPVPVDLTHRMIRLEPLTTFKPYSVTCGLYVELKKPGKHKTSPEQLVFQAYAQRVGYSAVVCVGWEAARDAILRYLGRA